MQKILLSGLVVLTAVSGVAQAAPTAKKGIRVVSSAKVLNVAEKASVTGMDCGCPDPVEKPDALRAEVPEGIGLDPVGKGPHEEVSRQVSWGGPAQQRPPTGPQPDEIEVAQLRDLGLDLADARHRQVAARASVARGLRPPRAGAAGTGVAVVIR